MLRFVIAKSTDLRVQIGELRPGLCRKAAACQRLFPLSKFRLERPGLPHGLFHMRDQALGLDQASVDSLAISERRGRVCQQLLVTRNDRIDLTARGLVCT